LWLFGKKPNAANILLEAMGGLASHPEGFVIYLSTQSDSVPAGVFAQKLQEFRDIRDGVIVDPGSLPVLYEYPKALLDQEAYKDPKFWYVTNPNLGASVDERYLTEQFAKADRAGRAGNHRLSRQAPQCRDRPRAQKRPLGRRQILGAPRRRDLTLDQVLDRSEVVVVGIDGGGLDDLFGLAVLGREKTEVEVTIEIDGVPTKKRVKRWLLWSHAWCHEGVLEERKSIASVLRDFAAKGELTIVDDELADLSAIIAHIEAIKDRGLLAEVAVDPAGLGELVDALAAIEVTEENDLLVGVGQGYRMMNAIKTAERRLANGTLLHGGSTLMNWCVGNVKIEPTATAIRATKQNAGDAKIDPWAALMNAVDRMSLNPAVGGSKPSTRTVAPRGSPPNYQEARMGIWARLATLSSPRGRRCAMSSRWPACRFAPPIWRNCRFTSCAPNRMAAPRSPRPTPSNGCSKSRIPGKANSNSSR
jgi:phage terminase large subunit-like protein